MEVGTRGRRQSWRTTGDLGLAKGELSGLLSRSALPNAALTLIAGPGGWNDPDYILIGTVGDALIEVGGEEPQHTKLTPDEQYSYMSMWSLMAAPLFFSGEMPRLDAFALNILCNSEVIDIDQDVLGKQAAIVRHTDHDFVLAKSLEDGALAVGLFNLDTATARLATVSWTELGLEGRYRVRDVWRQKDIGKFKDSFHSQVPAHDVVLVRLSRR